MSRVFPAGTGRQVSWLKNMDEAEDGGQTKLASTEQEEIIGTAAISMVELKRLAQLSDFPEEEIDIVEVDVAPEGEEPVLPEEEIQVSEEEEVDENPVDEAAEAVADAQEALGDAASALVDAGAEVGEPELEGEFEGEVEEEIEIPIEIDEEGEVEIECDKVDTAGEISEVVAKAKGKVKKSATEVSVEDSSRFVKIAKLSPVNKKKLSDYWIKTFGYDADWVHQMLRDYN